MGFVALPPFFWYSVFFPYPFFGGLIFLSTRNPSTMRLPRSEEFGELVVFALFLGDETACSPVCGSSYSSAARFLAARVKRC